MKKLLFYFLFTFVIVLSAFSQDKMVMEFKFTSNKPYRTLVVFNDKKNEAVEIDGNKKCHYDVEALYLDEYLFVVLTNPNLSGWTNEIYILSLKDGEDSANVLSPVRSSNALFPLEVRVIDNANEIAAKKREYGISKR